jgi:predicted RNA-binding Zn-ribbon protein involved in translation (DUF1610 family)
MTSPANPDPDRRVSNLLDRRETLGGGGRRAEDRLAAQFSAIIPCAACGVAWAALSSVTETEPGQAMAVYVCPRCGQVEQRAAAR